MGCAKPILPIRFGTLSPMPPTYQLPVPRKKPLFVTETPVEEAVIKKAIDETGYTYKGMKTEPYEKKGFFSRLLAKP